MIKILTSCILQACFYTMLFSQPKLDFQTFDDDFIPLDTVWVDGNLDYSAVSNSNAPKAFYGETYVGIGTSEYPFTSLVQVLSGYPHAAKAGGLVNVKASIYSNRGALYNFSEHHGYYDYLVTENMTLVVRESGTRQNPIKIYSRHIPSKNYRKQWK